MPRSRLLGALLATLALLGSSNAAAVGTVEYSIELLCELKRHIAIGYIEENRAFPSPSYPESVPFVFRAERILKGHPPRHVPIHSLSPYFWQQCLNSAVATHARMLVFFGDRMELDYVVSLDIPEACAPTLTRDYQVLRGEAEVMVVVAGRLGRMRKEGRPVVGSEEERLRRNRFLSTSMPSSPAYRYTFHGSMNVFHLPADPEYRQTFLRGVRSPHRNVRVGSAIRLGKFPGPETTRELRALLHDEALDSLRINSEDLPGRVLLYHPVRVAASHALRELGESSFSEEVQLELSQLGRHLEDLLWGSNLFPEIESLEEFPRRIAPVDSCIWRHAYPALASGR